jgi:adenosylcobinamide kinase/adenosylcobinamide-phosphate guanylyltransferase
VVRARSTLVLGGARSGKSRRALELAEQESGSLDYLATAQALDEEMTARIQRHREERGSRWNTIECPIDLPEAIARSTANAMVVDCLTLWLTNVMLSGDDLTASGAALIRSITASRGRIIIVSNEIGCGIVPDNELSRNFRDAAGLLNQNVAEAVDEVELLIAGIALKIK